MKTEPILNAIYTFKLKGRVRRLACSGVDNQNIYWCDVDTEYSFSWPKRCFGFMFRNYLIGKVEMPNSCPYLTDADESELRRETVARGESVIIPFGEEFKSSQDFEKSITFLLSLSSASSSELKHRTSFNSEELYTELQYFFDFPRSRTDKKKKELLYAYNLAFNLSYAEGLI
ncbi:MAG: hypothetical protein IKA99_01895 [Clostridia bacterium]|nr:hypothetical protein [Clostridia bacterium]